jgi:hypothetical protein
VQPRVFRKVQPIKEALMVSYGDEMLTSQVVRVVLRVDMKMVPSDGMGLSGINDCSKSSKIGIV